MGPPTHSRHRTDQRHDRTNGLAANRSLARDFTDVKFTDSTVLHALTYGQTRIAENDEDTLAIIAPTGGIARRLLTLTGLQEQTPQTRHAPTRSPSPDRVSPPTWAKFSVPRIRSGLVTASRGLGREPAHTRPRPRPEDQGPRRVVIPLRGRGGRPDAGRAWPGGSGRLAPRPRGGSQRPRCRRAPLRSRAQSQGPGPTLRGRRPGRG